MTAPDPVAAAVAARLDDCRPLAEAQGDVADLLAVVEAVLALHGPVAASSATCARTGVTPWPCPTYRAITAGLLGKEDTDG